MSNDTLTFDPSPREQGSGCSGCIKHLAIIVGALILTGCVYILFLEAVIQDAPANMPELCRIVGLDPETDPACQQQTGSLLAVLETAFPPKVATMERVREKLGPHVVNSWSTPYGTYESYAIVSGLLGSTLGQFRFDKAGTLIGITIED